MEGRKEELRVSNGEWRSRIDQAPSRLGDFQAVFLGGLDPQANGGLSLADGLGPGLAVGHAARHFRHFHHAGGMDTIVGNRLRSGQSRAMLMLCPGSTGLGVSFLLQGRRWLKRRTRYLSP